MQIKTCRLCNEEKQISDFHRHCGRKDGLTSECKVCRSAIERLRYQSSAEKIRARMAEYRKAKPEIIKRWRDQNGDRLSEYERLRWLLNKEQMTEKRQQWGLKNPDKVYAILARRRAAKLNAVTDWDQELDDLVISEAARLAKLRETATGVKHHIDHVVPLQGRKVCGLHNAYNLAVIPAIENLKKKNAWDF